MNHYDAILIRERAVRGQPVSAQALAEANVFIENQRRGPGAPARPAPVKPAAIRLPVVPPMAALCMCGARRGMHRVNDERCPNPQWRLGNGEAQWMPTQTFVRAGEGRS